MGVFFGFFVLIHCFIIIIIFSIYIFIFIFIIIIIFIFIFIFIFIIIFIFIFFFLLSTFSFSSFLLSTFSFSFLFLSSWLSDSNVLSVKIISNKSLNKFNNSLCLGVWFLYFIISAFFIWFNAFRFFLASILLIAFFLYY